MKAADILLERLKGVKRTETGWTARCPGHEDKQNSLSVAEGLDGKVLLKCFAGCEVPQIVESVGLSQKDLFPKLDRSGFVPPEKGATTQRPGCSLELYASTKRLSKDLLALAGVAEERFKGAPRLKIPYFDCAGAEVATRYRWALQKGGGGRDERFSWKTGSKVSLYGLWKLASFSKDSGVVLVEGESDCHTLWQAGFAAVGLPGAAIWKEEWARYLDEFEKIFVVIEPDKGGQAVAAWIGRSALRRRVKLLVLDPHKDPSAMYLNRPDDFKYLLAEAMDKAPSWEAWSSEEAQKKSLQAFGICKDLTHSENILDLMVRDLVAQGVVGVENEAKIIYLAVTSRLLAKPMSLAVKGPSASGKSYLVQKVLDFFPANAFYALTAMSDKVLAYTEEPLSHRILVIYEAAGMNSEFASYLVRTLLSEGCLKYETVEKNSTGMKARLLEKEGPTGLIVTTTEISLHPENETRLFTLTLRDTQEQTKKILMSLDGSKKIRVGMERWSALQSWLEGNSTEVSIPFLSELLDAVPPLAVRLRRDLSQVVAMIQSHVILHQGNRKRDDQGKLMAQIEDYSVVYELVAGVIQLQAGAGVSSSVRDTVRAVAKILGENGRSFVTQAELGVELALDKASISRRTRAAREAGYLRNEEARKHKPHQLVMGDPLPAEVEILPNPDRLRCCVEKRGA